MNQYREKQWNSYSVKGTFLLLMLIAFLSFLPVNPGHSASNDYSSGISLPQGLMDLPDSIRSAVETQAKNFLGIKVLTNALMGSPTGDLYLTGLRTDPRPKAAPASGGVRAQSGLLVGIQAPLIQAKCDPLSIFTGSPDILGLHIPRLVLETGTWGMSSLKADILLGVTVEKTSTGSFVFNITSDAMKLTGEYFPPAKGDASAGQADSAASSASSPDTGRLNLRLEISRGCDNVLTLLAGLASRSFVTASQTSTQRADTMGPVEKMLRLMPDLDIELVMEPNLPLSNLETVTSTLLATAGHGKTPSPGSGQTNAADLLKKYSPSAYGANGFIQGRIKLLGKAGKELKASAGLNFIGQVSRLPGGLSIPSGTIDANWKFTLDSAGLTTRSLTLELKKGLLSALSGKKVTLVKNISGTLNRKTPRGKTDSFSADLNLTGQVEGETLRLAGTLGKPAKTGPALSYDVTLTAANLPSSLQPQALKTYIREKGLSFNGPLKAVELRLNSAGTGSLSASVAGLNFPVAALSTGKKPASLTAGNVSFSAELSREGWFPRKISGKVLEALTDMTFSRVKGGGWTGELKFQSCNLARLTMALFPQWKDSVSGYSDGLLTMMADRTGATTMRGWLMFNSLVLKDFPPLLNNLMAARQMSANANLLSAVLLGKKGAGTFNLMENDLARLNQAVKLVSIDRVKFSLVAAGDSLRAYNTGTNGLELSGWLGQRAGGASSPSAAFTMAAQGLSMALSNFALAGRVEVRTALLPGGVSSHKMTLGGTFTEPSIKHDYSPYLARFMGSNLGSLLLRDKD